MTDAAEADMIARTARDWTRYAGGEAVTVKQIGGAVYGFTTEIGALRLYHKMRGHGRAQYSVNLSSWFYVVELKG